MAVAHDAVSESHTGTTGGTGAGPHTWTHGGRAEASGGVQGVLVFVTENTNADDSTAVTYGGVALSPVSGGYAVDTGGEPGTCKAWFRGSGFSGKGGNQTVSVSRNNNSNVMYCVCITVTAARNVEVAGTPVLLQDNDTITEQNVDSGERSALRYAGGPTGGSNPVAAGTNSDALIGIDYGTRVTDFWKEKVAGSGSRPVGGSYGTSDDRAIVHLAIAEVHTHPVSTLTQYIPGAWPSRRYASFASRPVAGASQEAADTLAVTEAIGAAVAKGLAETAGFTEALAKRVSISLADTLAFTESPTYRAARVLAETLTVTETLVNQARVAAADTLAVTEALAQAAAILLAETPTLGDTVTPESITGGRTLGTVTQFVPGGLPGRRYSSFSGRAGASSFSVSVGDALTLREALDLFHEVHYADTELTLTEALAKRPAVPLADTLAVTEALVQGARLRLADALAFSESVSRLIAKAINEQLGFSEQFSAQKIADVIAQSADDTLTFAETLDTQIGKGSADTLTPTETLGRDVSKTMAETLTLLETVTMRTARALDDSLAVTEELLTEVTNQNIVATFTTDESLGFAEATRHDLRRAIAEAPELTEILLRRTARAQADPLAFAEQFLAQVVGWRYWWRRDQHVLLDGSIR